MSDCIFCKIINKEIPSSIVYEDSDIISIKDINPAAPVHILVIPKKHFKNIIELNEETILKKIFEVIKKLSKNFNIDEKGFRIVINCNKDGGQTVDHLHFHILGGRFMEWPPG